MRRKTVFIYFGFAVASFFLFFFQMGKIPLWSSDEGRFAEMAREMWVSKNFIVPHFNYVGYLEKPVFSPFLGALFFGAFGLSSLTARLPSIFSALIGLFTIYFAVRRIFDEITARFSALILLTSVGYVLVGRFAVIDIQLLVFMSIAIFFLMSGCFKQSRRDYLLAYVFMGLAFLTKGLIGILLPALIFFFFTLWTGHWKELRKLSMGPGILIVALVTLPWLIAISIKEPEFFTVFIWEHHFGRFITGSFGRERPFWFFSYIVPLIAFPWIMFLPSAMAHGLKGDDITRDKIIFLICWMAVIFVFFSLPKSKLPYYIVPLNVPIAVLVATYFSAWTADRLSLKQLKIKQYLWQGLLACCLVGFIGLNITAFIVKEPEILLLRSVIQLAALLIAGGGLLSYLLFQRRRKVASLISLAGMIYLVLVSIIIGMVRLSPLESTYAFAQEIKPQLNSEDVVAIFSSPDHFSDFPFLLERRVMVVGTDRGTLAQESEEEEHQVESREWFLEPQQFVQMFNTKERRVFCLLQEERLRNLQDRGLENFREIKRGHGKLLITNR